MREMHMVMSCGEVRVIMDSLSDKAIKGIEEALEDIKHGRLHSEEEIMKEFDLKPAVLRHSRASSSAGNS